MLAGSYVCALTAFCVAGSRKSEADCFSPFTFHRRRSDWSRSVRLRGESQGQNLGVSLFGNGFEQGEFGVIEPEEFGAGAVAGFGVTGAGGFGETLAH